MIEDQTSRHSVTHPLAGSSELRRIQIGTIFAQVSEDLIEDVVAPIVMSANPAATVWNGNLSHPVLHLDDAGGRGGVDVEHLVAVGHGEGDALTQLLGERDHVGPGDVG